MLLYELCASISYPVSQALASLRVDCVLCSVVIGCGFTAGLGLCVVGGCRCVALHS